MEPIVSLSPLDYPKLSAEEEQLIDQVVEEFQNGRQINNEKEQYAHFLLDKMPDPTTTLILVDDLSSIDYIERVKNVGTYCSRAFTRAREGDIVLASLDPIPGYQAYMHMRLNLGNSHYIYVAPNDPERNYHLFESLKHDRSSQSKILSYAPLEKDLVIHPYMGSQGAWDIAALLSEARAHPVKVLAPLPCTSRIANNKNDFLTIVRKLCGEGYTIDWLEIDTRRGLEKILKHKAADFDQVVLRFPGSAGGMTTEVIKSEFIHNQPDQFQKFLDQYLQEYGWKEGNEKLQVSGWEPDVLLAPSSHLWIPPENDRSPIFEEILVQSFSEENSLVFAGSRVANLPDHLNNNIKKLTMIVGSALQRLGYVGRCSFDLLLCGSSLDDCRIKFVECNGRWGGASTPMTLMNRIFGDHRKHAYVHRVLQVPMFQGVSFVRFLEVFDDLLYDHLSEQGYAIVYNVAMLESYGQLDLVTIGHSPDEANERMKAFMTEASKRLI